MAAISYLAARLERKARLEGKARLPGESRMAKEPRDVVVVLAGKC